MIHLLLSPMSLSLMKKETLTPHCALAKMNTQQSKQIIKVGLAIILSFTDITEMTLMSRNLKMKSNTWFLGLTY